MYKMEFKLFGYNMRVEIILLCIFVGYILGGYVLCSCSKISMHEGFSMLKGACVKYQMGSDIPQSWENHKDLQYNTSQDWLKSLEGNVAPNPNTALDSGSLNFLGENKFDPKCCPSAYSNSMGCACLSSEQAMYVSQRGGNRTFPSEY